MQAEIRPYLFSGEINDERLSKTFNEIATVLQYFSLFRHPLTKEEIHKFLPDRISAEEEDNALDALLSNGTIKQWKGFYFLSKDNPSVVLKRIEGEAKAMRLLPKATHVARFLSLFPFVRFVGISGSLSKNYADNKTDYDFFIITANNTLWICRTILHVLKKLSFLVGLQHHLCMNYFLDEHHLQLDEKNIFVQIELSTLIPVYNKSVYRTFLLRNQQNLSNIRHLEVDFEGAMQYNLAKKDKVNTFWKPLNLFFMKLTDTKWKHKWRKRGYPMQDYPLAFKTNPYVSKNHPKNYQKKVLGQLNHLH